MRARGVKKKKKHKTKKTKKKKRGKRKTTLLTSRRLHLLYMDLTGSALLYF